MRTNLALKNHALAGLFALLSFVPARLRPTAGKPSPQTIGTLLGLVLLLATIPFVSAANLTWTGAVNGNWDTTTPNWFNGTLSTVFHTGDNVTFDNSASILTVSVISAVAPASVLVNISGTGYSIGGASIGGNGGLTKNGTGLLSLSTSNGYTGVTTINSGTLALISGGSISGSAVIAVAAGATLDASGRSDGTLSLASGQTLKGIGFVHGVVVVTRGRWSPRAPARPARSP